MHGPLIRDWCWPSLFCAVWHRWPTLLLHQAREVNEGSVYIGFSDGSQLWDGLPFTEAGSPPILPVKFAKVTILHNFSPSFTLTPLKWWQPWNHKETKASFDRAARGEGRGKAQPRREDPKLQLDFLWIFMFWAFSPFGLQSLFPIVQNYRLFSFQVLHRSTSYVVVMGFYFSLV